MGEHAESNGSAADELGARIGRLSRGQREVLLLVAEHLSSKEIAVRLGISPHTVDQRIRGALHILGVERRSHAARLVLSSNDPYQRLIHQSRTVEPSAAGG